MQANYNLLLLRSHIFPQELAKVPIIKDETRAGPSARAAVTNLAHCNFRLTVSIPHINPDPQPASMPLTSSVSTRLFITGTLMSLLSSVIVGDEAYIFDSSRTTDAGDFIGEFDHITIELSHRCYSIGCYHEQRVVSISWKNIPEVSKIAFYEKEGCRGKSGAKAGSSGVFSLKDYGLESGVRSFMVWESGMYMISGIVDLCLMERGPFLTNSSNVDGGGGGHCRAKKQCYRGRLAGRWCR